MTTKNPTTQEAARAADEWRQRGDEVKKATRARDQAMWRFLRLFLKIARDEGLRRRDDLRKLMKVVAPQLDSKTRSRYVAIARAVLRRKPSGIALKDWIKSEGGLARCR
jgi:hypothetical protein